MLLVLPQDEDTYVHSHVGGPFSLRYASVRSGDSKERGQPGQDYVAFRIEDRWMAFIVCDGVSQSFYGGFASKFLGERLLKWLEEELGQALDPEIILQKIDDFLVGLIPVATEKIDSHPIPDNAPAMLSEVLEQKRSKGSETTYVCGRIDLPGKLFPQGRAVFSWMGNTRLRLGKGKSWGTLISKGTDKDRGRWSSKKGPTGGQLKIVSQGLLRNNQFRFNRVLAYTDGVSSLDDVQIKPTDFQLQEYIDKAILSSDSDDSSFLEIEIP